MAHNVLPHIIDRELLELHLPPNSYDGQMEARVKDTLESARTRLETVLDLYDHPDQLIIIDQIFLDLGRFDPDELDLFGTRLCEALSSALKKNITQPNKHALTKMSSTISASEIADASQTGSDSSAEIEDHKIGTVEALTMEKALPKAFLYFLENGLLPWWLSDQVDTNVESIFETIPDCISATHLNELKSLLNSNTNAVERLIHQFSTEFAGKLIASIKKTSNSELVAMLEAIERYLLHSRPNQRKKRFIDLHLPMVAIKTLLSDDVDAAVDVSISILLQVASGPDNAYSIEELLSEKCFAPFAEKINHSLAGAVPTEPEIIVDSIGTHADKKTLFKANDEKKPDTDLEIADKFIYVHHAGLVVIHPFLSHFFSTLKLINESKQFIDEHAQMKAVNLLGYLSSGKIDLNEPELSFCKFLCGMPLKKAIHKNILMEEPEIHECHELLQAVIGYWSTLKNTSPNGLREAFLTRRGKLDCREDTTVLYVESKPVDVLLESLPWGLSYIHLPWLASPLSIIWN